MLFVSNTRSHVLPKTPLDVQSKQGKKKKKKVLPQTLSSCSGFVFVSFLAGKFHSASEYPLGYHRGAGQTEITC